MVPADAAKPEDQKGSMAWVHGGSHRSPEGLDGLDFQAWISRLGFPGLDSRHCFTLQAWIPGIASLSRLGYTVDRTETWFIVLKPRRRAQNPGAQSCGFGFQYAKPEGNLQPARSAILWLRISVRSFSTQSQREHAVQALAGPGRGCERFGLLHRGSVQTK